MRLSDRSFLLYAVLGRVEPRSSRKLDSPPFSQPPASPAGGMSPNCRKNPRRSQSAQLSTTRLADCPSLCSPLASRNGHSLQQIRIGFREPQSVPVAASSQIIVDRRLGLRFPTLPACTVSDKALLLALAHLLPSHRKAEPTNSSSASSLAYRS